VGAPPPPGNTATVGASDSAGASQNITVIDNAGNCP
jgi:hypothetical protein